MNNKGFTLIELLAVIVILAIIALIATPIILGIINDAREESNERSVELYASAVKNAIAQYQLNNHQTPTTFDQIESYIKYDGDVDCDEVKIYPAGTVYLEGCKANNATKKYSYGKKQITPYCTVTKSDSSKYSVGDLVTCDISGAASDKFYVIEDAELTSVSIKVLTELNIHTTEYRQSISASGINFTTGSYWQDEADADGLYVYNDNDIIKPIVNEYVAYLNTKTTDITGRLLTITEMSNLGCELWGTCASAPSWVRTSAYWTGTACDSYGAVYNLSSQGYFMDSYYNEGEGSNIGVRPVIIIPIANIKKQ